MTPEIQSALKSDRLIDITTIGRKSGQPHRIEITFTNLDGRIYISGLPGRRDRYANLVANPDFTFHLKQSTQADIPATATPIEDEARRRPILTHIVARWRRLDQLQDFIQRSPLVEVTLHTP